MCLPMTIDHPWVTLVLGCLTFHLGVNDTDNTDRTIFSYAIDALNGEYSDIKHMIDFDISVAIVFEWTEFILITI